MKLQVSIATPCWLLLGLAACTDPAPRDGAGACYAYTGRGDTIQISLTSSEGEVAGEMDYALAEKDRNSGTLAGEWNGDTLYARYTFRSEGVTSEREVAFLRRGDGLVEGYGTPSAGEWDFPGGMLLTPVGCTE